MQNKPTLIDMINHNFSKTLVFRLIFIFVAATMVVNCATVDESEYSVAIYYSPHPDDETLSMGAGITHNLSINKEVIVVVFSKGEASKAIERVNDKLETVDYPTITVSDFANARVMEYRKAVSTLGVKEENIYNYEMPDGKFDKNDLIPIIRDFSEKYPNALHNTMSYKDPHNDHQAAGQALRDLSEEGVVKNALYYIPIQKHYFMFSDGNYSVPGDYENQYIEALNTYRTWNPEENWYSIGELSVPKYFESAEKNLKSRWHR